MITAAQALRDKRAADAARVRMKASLAQMRYRTTPSVVAKRAVAGTKLRAESAVREGTEFVHEQPATIAAIGAAIVLLVFRAPIANAISELTGKLTGRPEPANDIITSAMADKVENAR